MPNLHGLEKTNEMCGNDHSCEKTYWLCSTSVVVVISGGNFSPPTMTTQDKGIRRSPHPSSATTIFRRHKNRIHTLHTNTIHHRIRCNCMMQQPSISWPHNRSGSQRLSGRPKPNNRSFRIHRRHRCRCHPRNHRNYRMI